MSKVQNVHLFNCDETYKFDSVEEWLEKGRSKQAFSVQRHYFSLPKMFEISNETIPGLNMDLAVFVVHAHESRLSINEEKAGIGYAMIYRALLEKTGDNVIIIIGGDDNYRDEDEESKEFISRWAKRKISSQFNDEYMDGRKGFILSWNKEHREIHEEALCHFLDPSKRGTKFEYKPKRKLPPRPEPEKTERMQQSERDSFSETSRTESAKLSLAMVKARGDPVKTVHLFNCDETYKFDAVEAWLEKERSKQAFSVHRHYFSLPKLFEISNETVPGLNMDLAVFVVHAHESRLSINEEKAGIGYAMIYRALLEKTGDNVIIIIGGDDNYRDEDEESKEFISRWAKRKISSQFNDEYMDGRKGFILSWNKEHREIHEEVLRHFLDPSKRGTKFEYKPKRKLPPRPEPEKKERTQQSEPDSFSEPSRTESTKLSSAMMKARSDPHQQAEQDSSLGRTTGHISSSELRSSSSGAVRNVGLSSHQGTSSGLPETQRNSVDLVILGCHISEETIDITKEVFLSLSSSLHIESHISKNCTPVEAKACLEKNVARFYVLLADAATVNDAYTNLKNRKREYEDLLQTAASRVAEEVIVVIFKPCSFPTTQDEILVTNSMESTLVVSGKGHVLYVEDDSTKDKSQRIRDIREKIISLFPSLKSQSYSNDSISRRDFQQSFNVTESTVPNTLKGGTPALPPQRTTGYEAHRRDYAYQSQQSSSMQPQVRSDRKGGFAWFPSTKKSSLQLRQNETVVLKTRLCNGLISQEKGKLEFIYPGWTAPTYLIDDLRKQYQSCPDRELFVISNEKGNLRWLVFKEGRLESIKNFFFS